MKRLVLITLSVLILTACTEDISPPLYDEEQVDLAAPDAPTIRTGDGQVQLTWSWLFGAEGYRVYRDEGEGSQVLQVAEQTQTSWTDETVENLKLYRYRVVGLDGDREGPRSEWTPALPALYTIVIAGDLPGTASSTVSLELGAPGGTAWMRLAELGGLDEAAWQSYRSELNWELDGEDGLRVVEAEFRDLLDNRSLPVSDSIILDSEAQILDFSFSPNGILYADDIIELILTADEIGGEAWAEIESLTIVPLKDDGVAPDTDAGDGVFAGRWVVGAGLEVDSARLWGHFTDPLGNEAFPFLASGVISVIGD